MDQTLLTLEADGLHVTHRSFGIGLKKTDWNLAAILESFYKNFKDSPARRSDYLA